MMRKSWRPWRKEAQSQQALVSGQRGPTSTQRAGGWRGRGVWPFVGPPSLGPPSHPVCLPRQLDSLLPGFTLPCTGFRSRTLTQHALSLPDSVFSTWLSCCPSSVPSTSFQTQQGLAFHSLSWSLHLLALCPLSTVDPLSTCFTLLSFRPILPSWPIGPSRWPIC